MPRNPTSAPAWALLPLIFACPDPGRAQGWEERPETPPCADSLVLSGDEGLEGRVLEPGFETDPVAGEDCDPDAALFLQRVPTQQRRRESRHASFSLSRTPGKPAQSVLRHQAVRNGWDHRLEIRGDSLTRRRIGWRENEKKGWRLLAGDLTDTALPLWPRALPRRTLPAGWKAARGTPEAPQPFSSALPQGFAAGVLGPGWKAYALRAWNPVETGREPPWHDAWTLRHHAAGASIAFPWIVALHASETRVSRHDERDGDEDGHGTGGADSLSERLFAAGLASPDGGVNLIAARAASDRLEKSGWLIGADLRRRFASARGATVEFTARQRDDGWASAWDPAYSAAADAQDTADRDWGAGEARLAGRLPFTEDIGPRSRRKREIGFLRAETWRAWNPAAGTERQGVRGAFGWRHEEARLELSGTHRTARSASGSVSLYRYLEADTRLESFPRWRAAAWRAWTRSGPSRTGGFLGAEPDWKLGSGSLRLQSGLRLEADKDDRLAGIASLGLRWRTGFGWSLDMAASLPCWPAWDADAARWRMTLTTGR